MSASSQVDIALVAAVEADAQLQGLLAGGRIYSGEIPASAPLDYVQLLSGSEDVDAPAFGVDGSSGEVELHIWTADTSRMTALTIYGHLRRVLRRLPLAGHVMLSGQVAFVLFMLDPGRTAGHAVCRYRWRTRVAAGA